MGDALGEGAVVMLLGGEGSWVPSTAHAWTLLPLHCSQACVVARLLVLFMRTHIHSFIVRLASLLLDLRRCCEALGARCYHAFAIRFMFVWISAVCLLLLTLPLFDVVRGAIRARRNR